MANVKPDALVRELESIKKAMGKLATQDTLLGLLARAHRADELEAERADVIQRLEGLPDSRLDGENGLAAATMRNRERLAEELDEAREYVEACRVALGNHRTDVADDTGCGCTMADLKHLCELAHVDIRQITADRDSWRARAEKREASNDARRSPKMSNDKLTDEEVAELARLEKAATQKKLQATYNDYDYARVQGGRDVPPNAWVIVSTPDLEQIAELGSRDEDGAAARLLAAARTAMPRLLAERASLLAAIAAARDALEDALIVAGNAAAHWHAIEGATLQPGECPERDEMMAAMFAEPAAVALECASLRTKLRASEAMVEALEKAK